MTRRGARCRPIPSHGAFKIRFAAVAVLTVNYLNVRFRRIPPFD